MLPSMRGWLVKGARSTTVGGLSFLDWPAEPEIMQLEGQVPLYPRRLAMRRAISSRIEMFQMNATCAGESGKLQEGNQGGAEGVPEHDTMWGPWDRGPIIFFVLGYWYWDSMLARSSIEWDSLLIDMKGRGSTTSHPCAPLGKRALSGDSRMMVKTRDCPSRAWRPGLLGVVAYELINVTNEDLPGVRVCVWDPGDYYSCKDTSACGMRERAEWTACRSTLGRGEVNSEELELFSGSDMQDVAKQGLAQMLPTDGRWVPPRQPEANASSRECITIRRCRAESEDQPISQMRGGISRCKKNHTLGQDMYGRGLSPRQGGQSNEGVCNEKTQREKAGSGEHQPAFLSGSWASRVVKLWLLQVIHCWFEWAHGTPNNRQYIRGLWTRRLTGLRAWPSQMQSGVSLVLVMMVAWLALEECCEESQCRGRQFSGERILLKATQGITEWETNAHWGMLPTTIDARWIPPRRTNCEGSERSKGQLPKVRGHFGSSLSTDGGDDSETGDTAVQLKKGANDFPWLVAWITYTSEKGVGFIPASDAGRCKPNAEIETHCCVGNVCILDEDIELFWGRGECYGSPSWGVVRDPPPLLGPSRRAQVHDPRPRGLRADERPPVWEGPLVERGIECVSGIDTRERPLVALRGFGTKAGCEGNLEAPRGLRPKAMQKRGLSNLRVPRSLHSEANRLHRPGRESARLAAFYRACSEAGSVSTLRGCLGRELAREREPRALASQLRCSTRGSRGHPLRSRFGAAGLRAAPSTAQVLSTASKPLTPSGAVFGKQVLRADQQAPHPEGTALGDHRQREGCCQQKQVPCAGQPVEGLLSYHPRLDPPAIAVGTGYACDCFTAGIVFKDDSWGCVSHARQSEQLDRLLGARPLHYVGLLLMPAVGCGL
ncbi:hypothetical protein GOP47_0014005 [Adiantum capillus-veneris]|uniref:Uncharacterized protein n=1 Tax=Adiantum capillus-veneris TaxID=13818 RepID=A0A9D4ZDX3_ADICA|nr:hypothetical protein GOP47_0014005 [Adiantum capillus-veneris]